MTKKELNMNDVKNSIISMYEAMDKILEEIELKLKEEPNNNSLLGARTYYKIAYSQFYNRFNRFYPTELKT